MSERLSGAVLVESRPKSQIDVVFEGLPVSSHVNLEFFSPLVGSKNPVELKNIVCARYLVLSQLRERCGSCDTLEVTSQIAISLLDDRVYGEILLSLGDQAKTFEVAAHEIGHSVVAENLGWMTKSITVVPAGNYLGLTESVPKSGLSFDEWAFQSAAISFGGKAAAEAMGHNVAGIGADMANAQALARLSVQNSYSRFSSEQAFLNSAYSVAYSAVSSLGQRGITQEAARLLNRQTIA